MSTMWLVVGVLVLCLCGDVSGTGYMLKPPGRSSMWRTGFTTPPNYNDNTLNCGGYRHEWFSQKGKCGVCGDPYDQPPPRDNEAGGKYARGVISARYKDGTDIDVTIMLNTNQGGYFEFRLCKNDDVSKAITQDCLDKHLLRLKPNLATRYNLTSAAAGNVDFLVELPQGLTCSQCVLQWKWHTANNNGLYSQGHSCKGCGPQEEFYACSDIAIDGSGGTNKPLGSLPPFTARTTQFVTTPRPETTTTRHTETTRSTTNKQTVTTPVPVYLRSSTGVDLQCNVVHTWPGFTDLDKWCKDNCDYAGCPYQFCSCSSVGITSTTYKQTPGSTYRQTTKGPASTYRQTTRGPYVTQKHTPMTGLGKYDTCHGVGLWGGGIVDLDNWCKDNCAKHNCPSIQCYCPDISGHRAVTSTLRVPQTTFRWVTTQPPPVTTSLKTPPPVQQTTFHAAATQSPAVTAGPTHPTPNTDFGRFSLCHGIGLWGGGLPGLDRWCVENCAKGNCPSVYCACPWRTHIQQTTPKLPTRGPVILPNLTPGEVPVVSVPQITPSYGPPTIVPPTYVNCHGVNNWKNIPKLDEWCRRSCSAQYCPPEICQC